MSVPEPPLWNNLIVHERDLDWMRRELSHCAFLAQEAFAAEDRAYYADEAKRLAETIIKIEEQANG